MTPEERAKKVVDLYRDQYCADEAPNWDALERDIAQAIRDALDADLPTAADVRGILRGDDR